MSSARPALELLPPCARTGIGSLPHTQGELALQMALQQDVPYLPQLPRGNPSELMVPAALDALPGLVFDDEGLCRVELDAWRAGHEALQARIDRALDSGDLSAFEPSVQACRSWQPFLFEVQARKLPFAKVQLTGPLTARWVTKTSDGGVASDVAELAWQIQRLLLAKAVALVKGVRRAGATPILFFDEPALYALEHGNVQHQLALNDLKLLVSAAQHEGALVGVHCCSNTDWPAVLGLGIDILSIDARLSLDALLDDEAAWLSYLATGATVCLGVIPTDLASTYQVDELCASVEASLRATTPASLSFEALLSRMLLSPACGLAMRSVIDAERITGELKDAQRRLRALVTWEAARAAP